MYAYMYTPAGVASSGGAGGVVGGAEGAVHSTQGLAHTDTHTNTHTDTVMGKTRTHKQRQGGRGE
jgi:hypothetical protein